MKTQGQPTIFELICIILPELDFFQSWQKALALKKVWVRREDFKSLDFSHLYKTTQCANNYAMLLALYSKLL